MCALNLCHRGRLAWVSATADVRLAPLRRLLCLLRVLLPQTQTTCVRAFILNLETRQWEKLERVNDCYELELEIVPYATAKDMLPKPQSPSGF